MNHFPRGGEGIVIVFLAFSLIVAVIIGMAKVFQKANKPGWACIIPIYNIVVELQIVGKSPWFVLLMLIPIVNVVFVGYLNFQMAIAFGKQSWFCVLAIFFGPLVLFTMGFDDSEYIGPDGIYPEFLTDRNNLSGMAHA